MNSDERCSAKAEAFSSSVRAQVPFGFIGIMDFLKIFVAFHIELSFGDKFYEKC